jgi:hypothetical protein
MNSKILAGIQRFLPQNFNDTLAAVLIVLIAAVWVLDARSSSMNLPSEVNGGLLVTWALVVQYYFRRSPPDKPAS